MSETKTRGQMFCEAMRRAGVIYRDITPEDFEAAFAEYDNSRAELPEAVEAYLKKIEPDAKLYGEYRGDPKHLHSYDNTVRDQLRTITTRDVPRLVAIIRAQGATTADTKESERAACVHAGELEKEIEALRADRDRLAEHYEAAQEAIAQWQDATGAILPNGVKEHREKTDARVAELETENKKLKDAIVAFTDMFASSDALTYARAAAGVISLRRLVD